MTEAYPLQWPAGWPRTPEHQRDRGYKFRQGSRNDGSWGRPLVTFAVARDKLYEELERLGAKSVVVSSNHKPDKFGIPIESKRKTPDEGIAMAGSLLAGRSVDVLVIDLPDEARSGAARSNLPAPPRAGGRTGHPPQRSPSLANRLERLAALARLAGVLFIVLEPPGLGRELTAAVAASTALRLELARRSWIRLGRDVVGQRTEVVVGRNRFGPTGRRAELRILYAEGGGRDACL